MSEGPSNPPGPDRKAEREARLAEALRANLKRRKAQARARSSAPPDEQPDTGLPPDPHTNPSDKEPS